MPVFAGFEKPKSNFSRVPHSFISLLPEITTLSELKVMMYLIRHTWGFSEYGKPKKLTTDEFMSGRKKRDGSRMDKGTGLSADSVIDGLRRAEDHCFIVVETDARDKGRIKKYYMLNMSAIDVDPNDFECEAGIDILDPTPDNLDSSTVDSRHRTEKETTKELRKESVPTLEKKPESVRPVSPARQKASRPAPVVERAPSATKLVLEAFKKHFELTLVYGHPFHTPFLNWAMQEIHMTPEMIAFAAGWWGEESQLRWRPDGPGMMDIQTNWLKSIKGFHEPSQQSQPRAMTREDMIDLGGI